VGRINNPETCNREGNTMQRQMKKTIRKPRRSAGTTTDLRTRRARKAALRDRANPWRENALTEEGHHEGALAAPSEEVSAVEVPHEEVHHDFDGPTADDALGLYLQQMGNIPLLTRAQELELSQRLEQVRARYRHAVLFNWSVLARVVEVFQRIHQGEASLERMVDVFPGLGLTAERIRARLARHLNKLRRLRAEADEEAGTPAARRRLRKAVTLAEELSPRTELVDEWLNTLQGQAARMAELTQHIASRWLSREQRSPARAELRALTAEVQATPDELQRLLRVARRRQVIYKKVRSELASANLRLVVSVAKRYRGRGLPFADLIQEGNSGLMRAVDKFDYRLGFKFGTYATWWIRQAVTRALHDLSRMVRVPCHQVGMLANVERVQNELTIKLGREPRHDEVAKALGIKPEDLRALRVAGRPPVSLDEPHGTGDDDSLQDFLDDKAADNPGEAADQGLLKDRIDEALRCLAPRDREVLELRFGLKDGRARTLDEVAHAFGITRERIRQIESRGLDKLRQPERSDSLAEFAGI
jgi:RNA polymerase primary sigma factor